ncbi:MAG: DNA-formamidopyrimidine glycosylase family protein [Pseudoclavibacter sp.]
MPEGDSVYRVCADLHTALAGRALTRADLRVPRFATAGRTLVGRVVDGVEPRGKHLLIRIGDQTLHSHLGMDGNWRIRAHGERWPAPAHQVRAVLETSDAVAIGTLLPVLELLPREREADAVGHLGPDLLDRAWSPELAATAVANLRRRPGRELAAALLDQRNLAGIGNEYVTELCFLRGVRPTATVAREPDAPGGSGLHGVRRRVGCAHDRRSRWARRNSGRDAGAGVDAVGACAGRALPIGVATGVALGDRALTDRPAASAFVGLSARGAAVPSLRRDHRRRQTRRRCGRRRRRPRTRHDSRRPIAAERVVPALSAAVRVTMRTSGAWHRRPTHPN